MHIKLIRIKYVRTLDLNVQSRNVGIVLIFECYEKTIRLI